MSNSKIVIYAAIGGNLAIAASKFVVAAITGSSATISEGAHSVVDTGNGLRPQVFSRFALPGMCAVARGIFTV